MKLNQVMWITVRSTFLLLLLLATACQGVQKTVRPEDRISLQEGGPHSGSWESRTISLEYQYYKQSGEIRLSAQASVKTEAPYKELKVWLLFADAQGRILEEKSILSRESTFKIPPGTSDLSFRTFLEPHIYKPPMSR